MDRMYRGPDVGVDWAGRNGFPCTCEWSELLHGDTCPEHGKQGVPIPTAEDLVHELREQLEAATFYVAAGVANKITTTAFGRQRASELLAKINAVIAKAKGQ